MQEVQYTIKVEGLVQGVGYRQATLREAQKLNLKGWVKNLSDGSVMIKAQGPEHSVERLAAWCHEGPGSARVSRVGTKREAPEPLESFEIRF